MTRDGVVKIIDFGLAKLGGLSRITKTHTTMGTVAYISPEQARGEEVDQRTDVWSLGVVLYEMLAARFLFLGTVAEAIDSSHSLWKTKASEATSRRRADRTRAHHPSGFTKGSKVTLCLCG